ncbi:MAG: RNB domain-containing ribonuclease [Polyangiales bacterium]
MPQRVSKQEISGRVDLRDLDLVTIDPATARDHDDALWATRTKHGGYRIVVAIADVSGITSNPIAPWNAKYLDRCTSIYLPDRAIPMLPPEISTNLASLVPDRDRLCMAIDIQLDSNGKTQSVSFSEAVMRSRAKVTYEGAAALGLTKNQPQQPAAQKQLASLQTLLGASDKI